MGKKTAVGTSGGAKGGMKEIKCLAQAGWWLVANECLITNKV